MLQRTILRLTLQCQQPQTAALITSFYIFCYVFFRIFFCLQNLPESSYA